MPGTLSQTVHLILAFLVFALCVSGTKAEGQCPQCPRGEGLPEPCRDGYPNFTLSDCRACPQGWFQDPLDPVSRDQGGICFPCTDCTAYRRETVHPCRPEVNAKCGDCSHGFYDPNFGDRSFGMTICDTCRRPNQSPECNYLRATTTSKPKVMPPSPETTTVPTSNARRRRKEKEEKTAKGNSSDRNMNTIAIILGCLLAAVIVAFVSGPFIYFLCLRIRRSKGNQKSQDDTEKVLAHEESPGISLKEDGFHSTTVTSPLQANDSLHVHYISGGDGSKLGHTDPAIPIRGAEGEDEPLLRKTSKDPPTTLDVLAEVEDASTRRKEEMPHVKAAEEVDPNQPVDRSVEPPSESIGHQLPTGIVGDRLSGPDPGGSRGTGSFTHTPTRPELSLEPDAESQRSSGRGSASPSPPTVQRGHCTDARYNVCPSHVNTSISTGPHEQDNYECGCCSSGFNSNSSIYGEDPRENNGNFSDAPQRLDFVQKQSVLNEAGNVKVKVSVEFPMPTVQPINPSPVVTTHAVQPTQEEESLMAETSHDREDNLAVHPAEEGTHPLMMSSCDVMSNSPNSRHRAHTAVQPEQKGYYDVPNFGPSYDRDNGNVHGHQATEPL